MSEAIGSTGNFLYDYFIYPVVSKTGYNPINTAIYAILAIMALYVIFNIFKRYKITIEKNLIYHVLAFVLLGSTIRVVTDGIDSGVLKNVTPIHALILDSHVYDYGFFTVSPGIYIVVAAVLLITLAILYRLKKPEYLGTVGLAIWLPHFLVLIPFMAYAIHAIPIVILAAIPAYIAYRYFKNDIYALIVAAHALDGAATFYVIDIFGPSVGKSYFEQHVIGGFIGSFFGTYFAFYLAKVAIAFAVSYVLNKEKEDENFKNFVALAIIIMGFAPGIRDLLRMVIGA